MALKLRLTEAEHEALDEAKAGLYVADGKGGFILDAEDVSKIEEFRTNNRTFAQQLEAWKALGMTAEQAKTMIETARKDADSKLSADQLLKKFEQQLAEKESGWQKERESFAAKLERYEVLEPLRQAALKAGAIPADVEDLLEAPSVKRRYRRGEDGKIQFLDQDGDPIAGITSEKFFESLAKEKPRFFQPLNPGGSGLKPTEKPADPSIRRIAATDQDAMNASLEDIAAGKAVVVGA